MLLQRAHCYWIPLAIAAATIVLPPGAPVGFLAIPGALLAAASFSRVAGTVGKRARAAEAAQTAGVGTDWGADLDDDAGEAVN